MIDREDNDNGYLWDKGGKPDPDVQHLEGLLGRFAHRGAAPEQLPRARRPWPGIAAAATILLVAGALWVARTESRPHWNVTRVAGSPAVADRPFGSTAQLSVGQLLETDAASRARLTLGLIGEVDISPNSRLRLVRANASDHRLALERGSIGAHIWAPPRLFFVQTKSALAVDLGCVYRLSVDDEGLGMLSVETGWVALVAGDREAVVPADASCRLRPGGGPGTPFFDDASPDFRAALDRLDASAGDGAALETLLELSRRRDALTLWHLLGSLPPDASARAHDRLAELVATPSGVTREGIARRDHRMLDLWRSQLGLPSPEAATLWQRVWKVFSPAPPKVR